MQVAGQFDGRVRFVVENFGESKLAERFGIRRYPALFVNDVLVAKPKDFGFFGEGGSQGEGRYTPWRDAANHERFRRDLTRMVDLALSDEAGTLRERHGVSEDAQQLDRLPAFSLTDLEGRALTRADLEGRVLVVEFWASWCPPCQGTLEWLGRLRERHGNDIAVLAIAVESPESDVRTSVASIEAPVHWAMGTADVARSFGDVLSVPTLFVFDRSGKTASVYYGAPPDLHERAGALIDSLVSR